MLSIVIPVHNEEKSLPLLHAEIVKVAAGERLEVETIFVDDGSTDGSWGAIAALARQHVGRIANPSHEPWVHGIRFRRNFGKAAALSAGFKAARGDLILTVDADLQDDPKEIPQFLKAMEGGPSPQPLSPAAGERGWGEGGGLDVVSGWKQVRHDPWHKVWPSRVFNFLVSWLTGVRLHDHNCGFKCYRAEVFREVRLYGELHRFIPVLAAARGFRVGELVIQHRPRQFGHSKYGLSRLVKGFLDLLTVKFLTGFGQRPQHLLGTIGLTSFSAGSLGMIYLGITWIINFFYPGSFQPLHERPLLTYSVAALLLGAK